MINERYWVKKNISVIFFMIILYMYIENWKKKLRIVFSNFFFIFLCKGAGYDTFLCTVWYPDLEHAKVMLDSATKENKQPTCVLPLI